MLTDITKEDFKARYLLGSQVAQEGVQSYEGRDTDDRRVLVHFLGPVEGPQAVPWLAALGALTSERRSGLIGAYQVDGEAILVTAYQDHVNSLAEWFVATAGGKKVADQTSAESTSDTAAGETGAAAYEDAAKPSHAEDPDTPTAESPVQTADSAQESGAGEFTRLFAPGTQGTAKTPRADEATEIIPRVVDPSKAQPQEADAGQDQERESNQEQGEFTRMFGAKRMDAPEQTVEDQGEQKPPQRLDEERKGRPRIVWRDQKSKPSPPPVTPPKPTDTEKDPPKRPAPEQPPGQFTEIFGRDLRKEPEPSRPATDRQPQGDQSEKTPAEDRSLLSDTGPRTPASGRPVPLSVQGSDDYLRALGSDSQVEPPKAAPTPERAGRQHEHHPDLPPPVSKPQQESAPGPGEYTRVISGGSASPQQSAAPTPAPSPAPTPAPEPTANVPKESGEAVPAKAPTWLWVVLAAIVLLMILLVVIVVLT